ncbi:type II toxin-antitoxin system VapC family toxin [soil metagenome]
MRFLLDTCSFLWLDDHEKQFGEAARIVLSAKKDILLLSHVSLWEMSIKRGIGKLENTVPLSKVIDKYVARRAVELLPIGLIHILAVEKLPHHHRDPFDRLLVAQALEENLPIISADKVFDECGVKRIWN